MVPTEYFAMDGAALVALTEEEFNQRAPQVRNKSQIRINVWAITAEDSLDEWRLRFRYPIV